MPLHAQLPPAGARRRHRDLLGAEPHLHEQDTQVHREAQQGIGNSALNQKAHFASFCVATIELGNRSSLLVTSTGAYFALGGGGDGEGNWVAITSASAYPSGPNVVIKEQ